jgi:L-glyceraldehyde 3-phosphate reductase
MRKGQTMIEQNDGQWNQERYNTMPYRSCGHSGLLLPAISLGAHETYGSTQNEESTRTCLHRAFNLGITHFDLANNYGRPAGNAEQVVGKILRGMPRDELIISSKAGYRMWPGPYGEWLSKKSLVASLDQSLRRLKLDYVDIFYAHRPDPQTPLEETMAALDLIVRQGKALYIGVSNFPGEHLERAIQITKNMRLTPITVHQPRYNLLERRCEQDLFPSTTSHDIGVIAFSPLAKGLLSDKYLGTELSNDSRAAAAWGKKRLEDVLNGNKLYKIHCLNALARERGQTLAQMALVWNLRLPAITSILIGASTIQQIEENVTALNNQTFSKEELTTIDRIVQT